jgi:cytochrome b6-f complex iron-sulfur subunit
LHYATVTEDANKISIPKDEFVIAKEGGNKKRKFVLVKSNRYNFPICLVPSGESYTASLMKCTHRGCELNIGGGIYSCPCHGSEFTLEGEVLQGPAIEPLTTFEIETDNDNIYIKL